MLNPLNNLLGVQAATMGAPDPLEEPGIIVEAQTNDPYAYENPSDVTRRDIGLEAGAEASDHKGMFGVRGTLRDVLGLVGDAFLVQSGNNPVYGPKRQQERTSDAMAGFTKGGDDALAAIERVAGINPDLARKMQEQYQLNQYRTGQVGASSLRANTNATREARMGREQAMDYVSQAYAAAIASGDPTAMDKALQLAQRVAQTSGMTLEELGVTENMTPQEAAVLAGRSATVNQNLRLPQQERSLDLREESQDERARANRVREGQQQRNEAGRDTRSRRTDRRVRELDRGRGRGNNGGQRQLRGNDDSPTESKRFY